MKGLRTVLLCIMVAGLSHGNRDPKFFLVSSTTSTTVSTTTSFLSTLTTCWSADFNVALVNCPGKRKRRSLTIDNESIISSKITRESDDVSAEIMPTNVDNVSSRKGKFFWYYMTTTTTTTSTSTSTSTSYTGSYTIVAAGCTPSGLATFCG